MLGMSSLHRLINHFGCTKWNSQVTGSCGVSLLSVLRQCQSRCKIGAQFTLDVPQSQKSFWRHSMVPLGDESQVEACFGPFGDGANLDARQVHGLCQTCHRLRKISRWTQWNSQVTLVMWNLISVRLETMVMSVQNRCRVCAKRTIGSEIILDAPDRTPR